MRVLLTGGAGYIGANLCRQLLDAGLEVVVYDSFHTSDPAVVQRIAQAAGRAPALVRGDVRDRHALVAAMRAHEVDAVIHLAALKSAPESVQRPLEYFDVNVNGTLELLRAMRACGVTRLLFSSSAAVYGSGGAMPLTEQSPTMPDSPYGASKLMAEQMVRAAQRAQPDLLRCVALRYFNPLGCSQGGLLGEPPGGGHNLMSAITGALLCGGRGPLQVFGTDYDTRDRTAIRDYIHVCDLAGAHLLALQNLDELAAQDMAVINLGSGTGHTVREVLAAFESATGVAVPHRDAGRRAGDPPECYASNDLAAKLLDWRPQASLEQMCLDSWQGAQRLAEQARA